MVRPLKKTFVEASLKIYAKLFDFLKFILQILEIEAKRSFYSQLCFIVTHVLYLTGFSEQIFFFKLKGQKGYHDGYTDIMVDIYSCNNMI